MSKEPKAATEATTRIQEGVARALPFAERRDFENAERGFIATLDPLVIKRQDGRVAYDLTRFGFLEGEAPSTVNPSLWRQAQLNAHYTGLFEVTDGIYQVRAFDLANMTLVRSARGWIVIDPLTSKESSAAALALANEHLGERPVVAVIHTHSHVDHFGGIWGVVEPDDISSGRVPVLAPEHFVKEALSENVMAGNVMQRRAAYMFGNLLPASPQGFVSNGLGAALSWGSTGFAVPTDFICETGEKRTLDGVEIVFQMTPGTEAPAEMVFYFPQHKTLCMSEITSHHFHNVYTPRGAQVRDALAWARQIQESLDLFGNDLEIQFGCHHWPIWGRDEVREFLEGQRDLYKFVHDQTMRLANHGYNMEEVAERLTLPEALSQKFYNRDYYGTVKHNSKAVYVYYLGYFDGHPSNLDPLPPNDLATRYVAAMGGAEQVVATAEVAFESGDYRWVAEILRHVVLVEPEHQVARQLLADTFEQLGYQAESGPWRNFYLTGARELREGNPTGPPVRVSEGIARNMPLENLFDALAVRLNPERADGLSLEIQLKFTDLDRTDALVVRNSVLHAHEDRELEHPDATLIVASSQFKRLMLGLVDAPALVESGELGVEGDSAKVARLRTLFDEFDRRFPILFPRA